MYGHYLAIPIPDIDSTSVFLMLGAKSDAPMGSIMTVPDGQAVSRRLKARRRQNWWWLMPRVTENPMEQATSICSIQAGYGCGAVAWAAAYLV